MDFLFRCQSSSSTILLLRSTLPGSGKKRTSSEQGGRTRENAETSGPEYCFHVPLIAEIFQSETTRTFRLGNYVLQYFVSQYRYNISLSSI
jgi:hypothetical protein